MTFPAIVPIIILKLLKFMLSLSGLNFIISELFNKCTQHKNSYLYHTPHLQFHSFRNISLSISGKEENHFSSKYIMIFRSKTINKRFDKSFYLSHLDSSNLDMFKQKSNLTKINGISAKYGVDSSLNITSQSYSICFNKTCSLSY